MLAKTWLIFRPISLPRAPYGSVDINLADIPYIPSGFNGSFDLTADQPIVGVTTLVGDLDADTDEYAQFLLTNTDTFDSIVFPHLQKSIEDGKNSEFSFFNNSTSVMPITVIFYNQSGIETTRLTRSIPSMGTGRFYTDIIGELGDTWDGYARVVGQAGSQLIPGEILQISRSTIRRPWTIMYYQAWDNDLDSNAMLYETYKLRDGSINPNVYIPVFRDTLNQSAVYEAYVDGQKVVNDIQGELNTGKSQTLSDFIIWAKTNFPAEHYALVIVDHGHGLKGTSWDLTTNDIQSEDYLSPKDFREALQDSGSVDVIFMEACLVANLENAYQSRGYTLYYVASEALMVAPLNHAYINQITNQTSAEQLARAMAMNYYDKTWGNPYSRTISIGDVSKIEQVAQATNAFASAIRAHKIDKGAEIWGIITGNTVQRFETDAEDVIKYEGTLADLYHFAQLVGGLDVPDLTFAAYDLIAAIDEYIIYNQIRVNDNWDLSNAHGLSIFLSKNPACYYNTSSFDFAGAPSWYCSSGTQTINQGAGEWGQMLSDLIVEFNPNPQPQYVPPPLVPLDTSFPNIFLPLVVRSVR
jgi:hypothetical protein